MSDRRTPERRHRRQVRNQITLPFLGVVALFVIGLALIWLAIDPFSDARGFSIIADWYVTLCCLVPSALLCLIPYTIFVAMAAGVWKGNRVLAPRLGRLRSRVVDLLKKGQSAAPRLATPVIGLQSRLARWERVAGSRRQSDDDSSAEEERTHGR